MASLRFEEPSAEEVRVQLYAIMLGEQLLCCSAAKKKVKRQKKQTKPQAGVDERPPSPSCMDLCEGQPMLEWTLRQFQEWVRRDGKRSVGEIVSYAVSVSPKMEKYMHEAYNSLLQTRERNHLMASIFFYMSWFFYYDDKIHEITPLRPIPKESFLHEKFFNFDQATQLEICAACFAFERGRHSMTSFSSFVHTVVINHWMRVV